MFPNILTITSEYVIGDIKDWVILRITNKIASGNAVNTLMKFVDSDQRAEAESRPMRFEAQGYIGNCFTVSCAVTYLAMQRVIVAV